MPKNILYEHGEVNFVFDVLVQKNLEALKNKYANDNEMYEKICALSFLLKKDIIPIELTALFNNDGTILENNIKSLA